MKPLQRYMQNMKCLIGSGIISLVQAICKCGIIDTFSDSSDIGELMRAVNRSTQSSNSLGTISDESSTMLLECQIIDGASSLSQGQKQLLCVARVLLRKFLMNICVIFN